MLVVVARGGQRQKVYGEHQKMISGLFSQTNFDFGLFSQKMLSKVFFFEKNKLVKGFFLANFPNLYKFRFLTITLAKFQVLIITLTALGIEILEINLYT